jgi:non-structural maintenance of chromosomes element 4
MKSSAGAFDTDDFVAKLIKYMGGKRQLLNDGGDGEEGYQDIEEDDTPLEWDKVGRIVLEKSRRVPTIDFLYVPLSSHHEDGYRCETNVQPRPA